MVFFDELKKYVDLRMEEVRLGISGGLSRITGAMLWILIAFGVLQLFLLFLCIALMQTLNNAVGEPWGALILCGALLTTFAILLIFRKKLFSKTFDRLFSSAFGKPASDIERETELLGLKIDLAKEKISFQHDFASLAAAFIKKVCKSSKMDDGKS